MSQAIASPSDPSASAALSRATERLLSLQHERGYWKAELETNVTMDAEDLLLRQFLGIRCETETRETARWIRSQQQEGGGWATHHGGAANLSVTVEAYAALRLAGDPEDAAHLQRARELICDLGGIEGSRVFTRIWLALFGEIPWRELPVLPPEIILLPSWFPLNVYDFACWARQTIVPLTVVSAHRPIRPLGFGLDALRVGAVRKPRAPLSSWKGRFQLLDRGLHRYQQRPLKSLRRLALSQCAEWILRRQEADGCWGGIQPPWVYSLMALQLLGYPLDHPAVKKGLEGLDRFVIRDDRGRRMEACQSPVWDTVLASVALSDAGLPRDHAALTRGADYLLDEEVRVKGDWAVRRPDLPAGGWAFEFENDNYPDLDDTAEAVLALRGVDHPARKADSEDAIGRAIQWCFGMQCRDGGFAAFDVDNTRDLCRQIPFCDFGEVIDPPSADVTAHVLEMLAREGYAKDPRAVSARQWLLRAQEEDGSWFGRWGANHLYGTGAAVPALIDAGVSPNAPAIRRAVHWLTQVQNEDGGWGETLSSYADRSLRGRGASTASQTAWALLALLAADGKSEVIERGISWLVRTQRDDGDWDEAEFTGTGFPGDFYIKYHLYKLVFPIMALGRHTQGRSAPSSP